MDKTQTESNNIPLSKTTRWLVFTFFCLLNSCLMIGAGIISSGVVFIKSTFQISDKDYGLIGTGFNAGSLIGSTLFISLSNTMNRKYMLLTFSGLHCISLLTGSFTNQFYVFFFCRIISGNGIVMWFIYYMVWIDQFGMQKWKSWMVSIIALSGQLSMLWGYVLNLIIGPSQWREGLRIECGLIFSLLLLFCFMPKLYFMHNLFIQTKPGGAEVAQAETVETRNERLDSIFAYHQPSIIVDANAEVTEQSEQLMTENKKKGKGQSKNKGILAVFSPMYIIVTLAKSAQFFVGVTVVYWFTDYAISSLNVTDSKQIFLSFTFVNIGANLIGIVLSGIISNAIGGYGSKHTLLTCFILKLIAFPFGAAVPFTNSFLIYSILLFIYNIFDVLAVLLSNSLIMIYVPKELKGAGNGIFSILANILAFLPSTYIYGYLKKLYAAQNPKLPLGIIMYYGFTSIIFMFIGLLVQRRTALPNNESQFEERKDKKEVLLKDIKVAKSDRGKA